MKNKKILILGASSFFEDAYDLAKKEGIYTIAVDIKDEQQAICKKKANVSYTVSTHDIKELLNIAKKEQIDGIYAGASESNIPIAIKLAKELNIPFYCNETQWEISTNKKKFKDMCIKNSVPVTKFYNITIDNYQKECENLQYPIVTKPVDSNGSTGVSINQNKDDFLKGFIKAYENSNSKTVLVEKFMPYDSIIVHYTMINGKAYYCGMSDKKSSKINTFGGPVMSLQYFPSYTEEKYLKELDEKVRKMYEQEGFKEGPIWIEVFTDGNEFVFNEMGYRFGGSMTYHPVKYYTNLDQIELLFHQTIYGNTEKYVKNYKLENKNIYCIAPIHLKPGKIFKIEGIEEAKREPSVHAITVCHVPGDEIKENGTVSQVFCYLHLCANKKEEFEKIIENVLKSIKVENTNGESMLFRIGKQENYE